MAHVLLIDDEPDIRDALRLFLEDEGHEVSEANNGKIGLEMLHASQSPLIVLVDMLMPVLDGVSMLEHVAESPELVARHGYVILSAAPNHLKDARLSNLPFPHLMQIDKPFDLSQVSEMILTLASAHASVSEPSQEGFHL